MNRIELVARPANGQLSQLPALIQAATLADGHEPLGEHKFLRLEHGSDLVRAIVAFEDDDLAGYAHAVTYGDGDDRRASCEFVVHPAFRRRGIGRMLVAHALVDAQAQGASRIDLWAYNDSDASAHVAEQFEFVPNRRLLHLHRHMGTVPELPVTASASIRSFEPGRDDAAWLELNQRTFAAHPDQRHWTTDDLHLRMKQPWFRADDFLIVERDGEMVGFNWLKIEVRPDEGCVGEIYVVGVDPRHQGEGIGSLLLASGLRRMEERGTDVAAIYVDESNSHAVALYESMGFHNHHVDVCYTRPLIADAGSSGEAAA